MLANDTSRLIPRGSTRPNHDRRAAGGRPIILLQGFGCSNRVMLPLEHRLRSALGRPTERLGRSTQAFEDIRDAARKAEELVETLATRPGFEFVDIVGHSMGGLVAAYLLKCLDRDRRVRRVVTLGTPYRGTLAALAGVVLFGFASRAVWQMVPGAPLLRELEAATVPVGSELISIGAQADRVVPERRTLLAASAGQRNVAIPSSNHLDLLASSNVSGVVAKILAAPLERNAGHEPGALSAISAAGIAALA